MKRRSTPQLCALLYLLACFSNFIFAGWNLAHAQPWLPSPTRSIGRIPRKLSSATLVAYYDARSIKGVSNGGTVSSWADLSGNNNTATCTTCPTYHSNIGNGKPGVSFNGSTQYMTAPDLTAMHVSPPFTVIAVVAPANMTSYGMFAGRVPSWELGRDTYKFSTVIPGIAVISGTGGYWLLNSPTVWELGYEFNGTSSQVTSVDFWRNGTKTETVSSTQTFTNTSGALWLGQYNSTNPFTGDILAFAVYNGKPTASERIEIHRAMCAQFNVTYLNPAVSPYLASATAAGSALSISVGDGQDSLIQPSVYDAGSGSTFGGHRYWMAVTTYPGLVNGTEDTLIYYSDDGTAWTKVVASFKALYTPPHGGGSTTVWSDPYLWVDSGTMYLLLPEFKLTNPYDNWLYYSTSTDGVTWTTPVDFGLHASNGSNNCTAWTTPNMIHNTVKNRWELYGVNICTTPSQIERRVSSSMLTGFDTATVEIGQIWPSGAQGFSDTGSNAMHWNIRFENGTYYAASSETASHAAAFDEDMWFITSTDGLNFLWSYVPLIHKGSPSYCANAIYMGTMTRLTSTSWDFWYSCVNATSNVSKIGRTTISGL